MLLISQLLPRQLPRHAHHLQDVRRGGKLHPGNKFTLEELLLKTYLMKCFLLSPSLNALSSRPSSASSRSSSRSQHRRSVDLITQKYCKVGWLGILLKLVSTLPEYPLMLGLIMYAEEMDAYCLEIHNNDSW